MTFSLKEHSGTQQKAKENPKQPSPSLISGLHQGPPGMACPTITSERISPKPEKKRTIHELDNILIGIIQNETQKGKSSKNKHRLCWLQIMLLIWETILSGVTLPKFKLWIKGG